MSSSHSTRGLHSVNVDDIDLSKFTSKEREEVESLQATVRSRGASHMEKDIALAKLDSLMRSKEPEPHNRKHRINELDEEGKSNFAPLNKDEAFERYEMGGNNEHHKGSKNRNQAENDFYAVKMNHKAPGSRKEWAREDYLEAATDTRGEYNRK